jgi:hypothetical protein
MRIIDISLSSHISYHQSSQFVLYSIMLLYSLIKVGFHYIYLFSPIVLFVSHLILNIIWITKPYFRLIGYILHTKTFAMGK